MTALAVLAAHYRVLPALAGRSFLPIAFLARLPFSMTQIGTVVLVTTSFGSVGAGGLAAGFLAVGSAVGGPVIGSLSDRLGQRPVVLTASLLNATTTLALVALVAGGVGLPAACGAALLAGASTPQIGPLVRARWVSLTRGGPSLGAAMSYEGAADETGYVLGPAVVSLLAAVASPAAAMVVAALLVGVFGTMVALHPTAGARTLRAVETSRGTSVWRNPRVLVLIGGGLAVGCFFGGMQTGVTGIAEAAGVAGAAGGIYAIMGIGSAVTGLACAALPVRFALPARLVAFAAAMAIMVVPLLFVGSVPAMMAAMVPLGCAVGPYIITLYSLGEREVAADRAAAVMTLLASGLVVGYAVGSGIGGQLVDAVSPSAAFALAGVAMTAGAALALGLRRARQESEG